MKRCAKSPLDRARPTCTPTGTARVNDCHPALDGTKEVQMMRDGVVYRTELDTVLTQAVA